jgi:hypothetical protein
VAAWSLLIGGLVVSVAGGVFVAVSQSKIEENRTALMNACMTYSAADTCMYAKQGTDKQEAAQTAANDIVTWKGARLAAEIGLGVGVAVAVSGVVVKLVGGGAPPVTAALMLDRDGRPALGAAWRLRF